MLQTFANRVRQHIEDNGELPPGQKFKLLSSIPPNTVLEALSCKTISTSVGHAVIVDVIENQEVEGKEERVTYQLMIPDRFEDELKNLPCVLYYRGKQPMSNGQLFHDLQIIKINDETVFKLPEHSESDQNPKPKRRVRTVTDDNTLAASMQELYNSFQPCNSCEKSGSTCYGFCGGCGAHQPDDGSQCVC